MLLLYIYYICTKTQIRKAKAKQSDAEVMSEKAASSRAITKQQKHTPLYVCKCVCSNAGNTVAKNRLFAMLFQTNDAGLTGLTDARKEIRKENNFVSNFFLVNLLSLCLLNFCCCFYS